MTKRLVPVMTRVLVKRIDGAVPLFYAGDVIEIRDEKVYHKGGSIEIAVPVDQVMLGNREVEGEVIALGPFADLERFGTPVKVGDRIRYSCYAAGGYSRLDGEKFDLINDQDVHTVVVED